MAMKAKLTKEDHGKLTADLQKEYVEKDGTFVLDVTAVDGLALDDVGGLKSSLQKERENVRKATESLAKFKDLDPDKAREALTKLDEYANWDPEEKLKNAKKLFEDQLKTKFDLEKKQLVTKHETDLNAKSAELTDAERQLHEVLVQDRALQAITKQKGVPELLLPVVTKQLRVTKKDGKRTVDVLDKDGQTPRLTLRSGSTDPMSIDEYVEELRSNSVYARAFEASGTTGSGAVTTSQPTGSTGSVRTISSADARDVGKYRAAREAATKAGQQLVVAE